jgi:hypothetical protein
MTEELELYLRSLHRREWQHHADDTPNRLETLGANYRPVTGLNLPGIGPGRWDSKALGRSQETAAVGHVKHVYRLYTEDVNRVATIALVKRYFDGATLTYSIGLDVRTQANDENAVTIEIVTSKDDALQRVLNLAGDIRERNQQISVLITRETVTTFEVTERTISHGEL